MIDHQHCTESRNLNARCNSYLSDIIFPRFHVVFSDSKPVLTVFLAKTEFDPYTLKFPMMVYYF